MAEEHQGRQRPRGADGPPADRREELAGDRDRARQCREGPGDRYLTRQGHRARAGRDADRAPGAARWRRPLGHTCAGQLSCRFTCWDGHFEHGVSVGRGGAEDDHPFGPAVPAGRDHHHSGDAHARLDDGHLAPGSPGRVPGGDQSDQGVPSAGADPARQGSVAELGQGGLAEHPVRRVELGLDRHQRLGPDQVPAQLPGGQPVRQPPARSIVEIGQCPVAAPPGLADRAVVTPGQAPRRAEGDRGGRLLQGRDQ